MKTFIHLNTSTGGSTGIEHAHGNEFFSSQALSGKLSVRIGSSSEQSKNS